MMNVRIICLGKLKERYLRDMCDEYVKRLGTLCKISIIELNPERLSDAPSQNEIKAALEKEGKGYFPDAPTERGIKHIRELIKAKEAGYHAILAFVIQMDGVDEVRANTDTHPEFGLALDDAKATGVEILFLKCHVEPDRLEIIN